jgi:thiamine pyrophosphate-dependent acetolactate synthase large subunit-like protein
MAIYDGKREAKRVADKPAKPLTVRLLRDQLETFGRENWMVTIVPFDDGGYTFHAHPSYGFKESRVIQSEKARKVRVFKNIESALNLARAFGFTAVNVEL